MPSKTVAVLSLAAGALFGIACIALAALEFCPPSWQVNVGKGGKGDPMAKGLRPITAVVSNVKGLPSITGSTKAVWKDFCVGTVAKDQKAGGSSAHSGTDGPGRLVVIRAHDTGSAKLADLCAQSRSVDEIILDEIRTGESTPAIHYDLHNVSIASILVLAPGTADVAAAGAVPAGSAAEQVTLNYQSIDWTTQPSSSGKSKSKAG